MTVYKNILCRPHRCVGLVRRTLAHYWEWSLDAHRYYRSSALICDLFGKKFTHVQSDVIRLYHVIEKSLSMPVFRPRAAIDVVKSLHQALQRWDGASDVHIRSAWTVLAAYKIKHREIGVDVSDVLPDDFLSSCKVALENASGGVRPYLPPSESDCSGFKNLVKSRVSVRNFDLDRVPNAETLQRAVLAAMGSPSVCNRQTWKAHYFHGQQAQNLLALQNGNRGFGHTIPVVFVITSDLRLFTGTSERYQAWIDGGMFAMSLLLALHAERLGAVALNWSVLNKRDRELRHLAFIPEHERIIMLIGCGHPADGAMVPVSTRRSIDEVFISHDNQP